MVGPLVVGAGSDITAVEQRVVVQSVALGRAIHPYPGSTIPYHVVIQDKVPTVVVEVDAGVGTLAPVVVNPIVCDARALPISSIHRNQPEILTHQSGIRDVVVANVVSRIPVQLNTVAPGAAYGVEPDPVLAGDHPRRLRQRDRAGESPGVVDVTDYTTRDQVPCALDNDTRTCRVLNGTSSYDVVVSFNEDAIVTVLGTSVSLVPGHGK